MPRETAAAKYTRTQNVLSALGQTYPDAHCELNFSKPLELLIATILSAQCTDQCVNLVKAELSPLANYCFFRGFATPFESRFCLRSSTVTWDWTPSGGTSALAIHNSPFRTTRRKFSSPQFE